MKKQPKQLVNSEFERRELDAYYTDHWMTRALLTGLPEYNGKLRHVYVDPACGRGDILAVIKDERPKAKVQGFDIDGKIIKRGYCVPMQQSDFLNPTRTADAGAITYVVNPPFGPLAQKFLKQCLDDPRAVQVAFLLRSLWNTAPGRANARTKLFTQPPIPYAYEIVLTERPRWDWWYVSDAKSKDNNKPFHSYSWHVWDRSWKGRSTQFWVGNDGQGRLKP